ncbi:diphthine methyltransferase [Condylostylus longicornis]|uniref:diphthine methyltransferase n=1 Tax=Condylostylus longicornis TaxID=2530218 RepID=UPI00244DDBF1|nr:diphthine methyltransferase [Condylostylus longicornis]
MNIQTLHTVDTEYSADSVEWCLHPNFSEYFACGTYQLDDVDNNTSSQAPCRRKGRIYLFKYELKNNILKEEFRLETAAILDMKWLNYHREEFPILGAANALGEIHIYNIQDNKLVLKSSIQLNSNDDNLLALSLEWSPNVNNELNNYKLITSDSKGCVSLLNYDGVQLIKLKTWSAHNFEAWTCSFDKWNFNRIFTGGDDTTLNSFDIRDPQNITNNYTNYSHIAGVTAMLSHPKMENILITGSYDDRLRIFDTRNLKNSVKEVNLEGGIWRIRSDPITHNQNLLLCACMYKNFTIVKIFDDSQNMEIKGAYEEHESICYGADWCQTFEENEKLNNLIMGTCSFYDHKLCVSKIINNSE